jgi:hypothetical protein
MLLYLICNTASLNTKVLTSTDSVVIRPIIVTHKHDNSFSCALSPKSLTVFG